MEIEKLYCIYCKRELTVTKRRKNQFHIKCFKSIYGSSSDIIFQGELIFKNDYTILKELEGEINALSKNYRLIKLTNLIHMFENFSYVVSNRAVIGLDLKFQIQSHYYKLKHLQSLYLTQFNNINPFIGNLKNLKTLVLKHCIIQELPESISKLSKLEYLEISGITGLNVLPPSVGDLKNLQSFKFAPINEKEKIQELPETFKNLQKLEFFYISGTNLQCLPQGFENLINLQELYILSRSINEIPPLLKFKKLRIFECQAKIESLPESFSELENLEEFKISNTALQKIPNVSNLKKLTKIEIHNSLLTRLPDGIEQLQNLKSIIVNQNPLERLPDNLSQLKILNVIDVSQTSLKELPKIFTFPELKKLNLDRTGITNLPQDIFLPKLEELRINCFINGVSKFLSLKQLFIMNTLPGKELLSFPNEIFELHNLVSLDIGEAKIEKLPDKFENLPRLRNLYIHRTLIRSKDGIPKILFDKLYTYEVIIYIHPDFDLKDMKIIGSIRKKF